MHKESTIVRAQSLAADARTAAAEFRTAVDQPDMTLVAFFCSADYDLDLLAEEIARLFVGVVVVGCTTAGEIGPAGCSEHSLTGMSFGAADFAVASGGIDQLQRFDVAQAAALTQGLMQRLEHGAATATADNTFGLLLIDGLSVREEPMTRALQQGLGHVPLVGGSAGDGVRFDTTYVYYDGAFHTDAAVLILISTELPFRALKIQHFVPTDDRVVVTKADAQRRIVFEIDGQPATEAYARLVGTDVSVLDPLSFAAQPVVVMIAGTNYVRSIQKANPDGSLTFFCAIEEGVVLRAAYGADLLESLDTAFAELREQLGDPQLIIAFDCILRKLENSQRGISDEVSAAYRRNNIVGFNSYGEQYQGVHVNQTLTGIAIGGAPDA
jgi:hypothetical protein